MSVILRHALSGFCYGGPHCWVNGLARARDLETIERAIETGKEEAFGQMEVVAWPEHPDCQLVIPLRSRGASQEAGQPAAPPLAESSQPS